MEASEPVANKPAEKALETLYEPIMAEIAICQ
jgi:hypothetical protein